MSIKRLKQAKPILYLLALFLILGSWYAVALPIFEGADEISHFRVIEFIAAEKSLPHIVQDSQLVGHESGQPPLYYLLMAPFIGLTDRSDFDQVVRKNPHFLHLNSNSVWYHTPNQTGRWHGTGLAVTIGRLLSLLMGAITIWCTWALARHFSPHNKEKEQFALLAAGLVAFNPQFLAISASLNNDNLVVALCSLALLLTVRWLWLPVFAQNDGSFQAIKSAKMFLLGIVIGLAVLAKISAIAFGAVIAVVLFVRLMQQGRFWAVIQDGLLITAGFLLTAGWWFWRNQILYGDPLGLEALSIAHAGTYRAVALTAAETWVESQLILKTFWLFPGNGTLFGPAWFYWVINCVVVIGLLGLIPYIFLNFRKESRTAALPLFAWVALIVGLLFYWISTVGATSQGRLMYPALSALAVLIMLGFFQWGKYGRWLAWGAVGFLAIFALFTPAGIIRPAFAHPETLPAGYDYPNDSESASLTAEIQLLGYEIETGQVSIGERPVVRLFWQAVAPVPSSHYVTLHFVDAAGTEVSRYEGYPFAGRYPTVLWRPGKSFVDEYRLPPISNNAAPGLATVFVELTQWKGTASTELRPLSEKIKVRLTGETAEPEVLTNTTFGRLARLNGYSLDVSADELNIELFWEALEPDGSEQTVFVHLLNSDGELVAQGDGVPRGGTYPTSTWEAGETVPDEHRILLTDVKLGVGTISVGFYDPVTGGRQPVVVDGESRPEGFTFSIDLDHGE